MTTQTDPLFGTPKTQWGPGPWQNEPDREEWRDATTGLPCLAIRGPLGAWCGYVGVPPKHPWHGKNYDDVAADVHGGLTYSDKCSGHICHTPAPGESDNVWWLGFDCGHGGDYIPVVAIQRFMTGLPKGTYGKYRSLAYVKIECIALAKQAELVKE